MKNLLIYINPKKEFSNTDWGNETETLVKIQIDNSLALGWKKEDIVLVTNFPYAYGGVEATVIGDDNYCTFSSGTPSKINAIVTMFEQGIIEDDTYWLHDFDAFQLEPLGDPDLIPGGIALTDYGITHISKGRNGRWSTGVIFFDKGSRDVFEWIKTAVYKYQANEEVSLLALTRHDKHGICSRIRKLDITHNFATRRRDVMAQLDIAELPIKVIHFHPFDKRNLYYIGKNNMEACVYGENPTGKPLVTERLIAIFKHHGIV